MNKFRLCLTALLALSASGLFAFRPAMQNPLRHQRRFRVMEWNVENFFDTIASPNHDDKEFTPKGKYHWDSRRYRTKLGHIERVIAAAGGVEPADIVMLCEVEGDSALKDLTERTKLKYCGYRFFCASGHDLRGINVALLYQPLSFRPLLHKCFNVSMSSSRHKPTRDALYLCGLTPSADTLDIFAAHLPSRAGGGKQSEEYRLRVAREIRRLADSIHRRRTKPRILILGDFNDTPGSKSLKKGLQAKSPIAQRNLPPNDGSLLLYNLTEDLPPDGSIEGTYKFAGRWDQLDQILVSEELMNEAGTFHTTHGACRRITLPCLLEKNAAGEPFPYRTFRGTYYHGGYSDHLPMVADFFY